MLTAKRVEAAKSKANSYRLSDGPRAMPAHLAHGPQGVGTALPERGRKAAHRRPWRFRLRQRDLAGARSEAQRKRDLLRTGIDPRATEPTVRADEALLKDATESWYRLNVAAKYRRPEQVREHLDRHILPRLGDKPVADLERGNLFIVVAGIADGSANEERPAVRVAAQVLQYLKRISTTRFPPASSRRARPKESVRTPDSPRALTPLQSSATREIFGAASLT